MSTLLIITIVVLLSPILALILVVGALGKWATQVMSHTKSHSTKER